jgi:plasmid stabilization system protein ParE
MRVRISAAARDDIARVLAYLMDGNPAVASQLSGRFREHIGRLGTFPELGARLTGWEQGCDCLSSRHI